MELFPLFYKFISILFYDTHCPFEVFRLDTVIFNQFNVWLQCNLGLPIRILQMYMNGKMSFA